MITKAWISIKPDWMEATVTFHCYSRKIELIPGRIKWMVKRCQKELKKKGFKKRKALEDDAAKCAKLSDIFSRRQTSTQELLTQGTVTIVHLHLCIWQTLLFKVTYNEGILFYSVQFFFFYLFIYLFLFYFWLSVSIKFQWFKKIQS